MERDFPDKWQSLNGLSKVKTSQPVNSEQGHSTVVKLSILRYIWQVVPL